MFPFAIASRGSFRRQLILTFVVGFFGLAVTFAAFMVANERANLFRNGRAAATGLVQSLAVSARSWVLANDVIGMQEVVQAFRDYPDLRYAMIIAPSGRVLAHNDTTKVGQYVADERSLALLKAQPEQQLMRDDDEVVEVALPIAIGERQVGWARVALGREQAQRGLYELVGSIAVFVLVVTLLLFIAALIMVNRLGRRIGSLVEVAEAVQAGDFAKRVAQAPGQEDEVNRLAGSLNLMLDTLSRNEEQVRSVSRYTRSLIEASLDPLVTISPEGKITDVNLATEMATGRSRDELVGTDFSEYFTEPDKARAGYRQVFAQGSVTDYPLAIRHRDGHVSAVVYNASVYRNEEGEVQGVFASARDISEQQRAVLLRAQLAAIVESSNDAIIGKTLDGVITSWNKGAEKIYGYSAEEVIGKSVTLLAPAAQYAEMYRLLETVRNGGTVQNHEAERVRKDGAHIHVALTLSPIRDASGKVSGISTIARDISEQQRMEQERVENLRYFESMDRVDRAMQQAKDLEGMLNDVLGEVLDIFDCDRVGLVYPCDPSSPTWQIVMERAKPGFSSEPLRGPLPMSEARADSMRWLLEKDGPVQFSPEDDPDQLRLKNFGILSFMSMAVRPRIGNAWEFGIHQCTHVRTWNTQEARLFEEIARRLADGLNIMLANRDLRGSEQRYHLVFESSPVSIWEEDFSAVKVLLDDLKQQGVTDLDVWLVQHPETITRCAQLTKILDVNSAAIGLHGAPDKEGLLTGLVDTFTPESFETFRRELVCLWNGGTQMAEDAVVRTLQGELRNVTIYFSVCPGYETTWGKVIVSLVDITERKQSLEQIRQSETKYRTLIQKVQVGVVVHGVDTKILVSNSMAQEILGLTEDQLSGKSAVDPAWHFFREDGAAATLDEYPVNKVLESHKPLRNLILGVHRPNHENDVWALVNADPVFSKEKELAQIIVTFIDISERVQAEQALRAERGLFVAGPSVVFKWRAQEGWPVEYVSPNVASQFGYVPEDITSGKVQYSAIVHPDDIARVASEVAAYSEQGVGSFEQRYRIAGSDGHYRWIDDFTTVIRGLDGSITHYLGYLQDVTERKRAEDITQARLRLLVFASSHSLDELLTATLNEAELLTGSSIGFYHFVEADQKTLSLHSWSTNTIKNMCTAEGSGGHYAVDKAGVWADCVRERRPLIHNDYASLPHRKGMPEGHAQVVREAVVPIFRGERIVAIIGVGNKTFNYDESDIGIISQLGDFSWDVAARMRVEENLRQMNERFSLSTRAASLGVWDWNLQKNELVWDDRMYELYGVKRQDFAGAYEAWLHGIHPDDRAASDEISKQAQRGEREYDTEFRVVWPDGSIHYLKAYGRFVRDAEGKPLRMTGVNFDITERKQAEETLRREQTLLNRIMVTSPVGIAVVNKDGQVTFANPQAERILGLSKEKITQLSYNAPEWHSTAIDGGPFPDEAQPFSRVMATRQPVFDVQHAIAWPDGRRVLLSINGAPLFDAKGEIEGVAFAIEDITERKLADETLRRNERSLVEAQRIAHLGSWHMDLASNEMFWSEELYKMYGFDPALPPPMYTESMKLFTPESWEKLSTAIARAVETGVSYELELEMALRGGNRAWMWARGELVRDEHGKAVEVRGVVMDITERKLAELALLEQQAHSNSLLHLSRRLERAQSYAEILAAASDEVRELIGYRNLWVYLLSDDHQYFTALIGTGEEGSRSTAQDGAPRLTIAGDRMLEQIAAAKEIVLIEDAQTSDIVNKEIVRKLGNRTIVNIPIILFDRHLGTVGVGTFGDEGVKVPTPNEQKYLLAMASHMAAALDRIYLLNERRRAEQEVQELNRGLEQRVAERTEQLEAANKELESFSYSVSHDLRSPLRAIDGFSHILLEDYTAKLDDDGKRMLGIVRDNTQRMGQLIDDILKFSRSGRSEIYAVEVDMAALAREVLDELQIGVAKVAGLHCAIGELPSVKCDRAMMHQVLVNLISNALKFSRTRETPMIEVGGSIQGDEIVYHVKDNGVGFDMQYADKLFGVFQRLHSMEEFEGTGIGLAIVKRIVTRHGGRVWAEAKVNEGATMYFTLPRSGVA